MLNRRDFGGGLILYKSSLAIGAINKVTQRKVFPESISPQGKKEEDKTTQEISPLPKLPDWGVGQWNTIFCQFDEEALPYLSKDIEAWADIVGCHV